MNKVYIIKDKGDLERLRNLFSKFKEIDIIEYDQVFYILDKEEMTNSKNCTIFVKQSSISNLDSNTIYEKLCALETRKNDFDLFYLTTWGDACQKRREFWKKHDIYTCHEPNGFQGVMITPNGRKRLLGLQKMKNGHKFILESGLDICSCIRNAVMMDGLIAVTSVPPLIHYNHDSISCNEHYSYLNHCRHVNCDNSGSNTTAYVWCIVAFIVLILILWAYFFGKKRYY